MCITFCIFTRFDETSSDEDVMLLELARGVGKLTGDSNDGEDKLYAEADKDVHLLVKIR